MERVLRYLGYRLPNQVMQEKQVVEELFRGNTRPLKNLCKKYDAFQDMPFSKRVTYAIVDSMFPGSKFILTVREPNAWFASLTRYHLGGFLKEAGKENLDDISELTFKDKALNLQKDYLYNVFKRHALSVVNYKIRYDWSLVYDKAHRIVDYEARNREILSYFQDRPNQLLVIDITKEEDNSKIVDFLDLPRKHVCRMPHLNRSQT